jgi:hypothetical protein
MHRSTLIAACLLAAGCDVASMKDAMSHSEETSVAIEKQVGVKPFVGFNYTNGALASVTVQFTSVPSVGVTELQGIANSVVQTTFKSEPQTLIISFAFQKKS